MEGKHVLFVAASQTLYGPAVLQRVEDDCLEILDVLRHHLPYGISYGGVLKNGPEISRRINEKVNTDPDCIGLIVWAHTFSPSDMWARGLRDLRKPLLHLHTQFNYDLPWSEIDMDFMNLNQSAHGDVEFAHMLTELRIPRATVVGYWDDYDDVKGPVACWARAAMGIAALSDCRILRIGGRMNEVAGTDVSTKLLREALGVQVLEIGVSELEAQIAAADENTAECLLADYQKSYDLHSSVWPNIERLKAGSRIEAGLAQLLSNYRASGFTTNFQNLGNLDHLPGLEAQRLAAAGYGFGPEGDVSVAILGCLALAMTKGLPGGGCSSLMEPYTYHQPGEDGLVLGAHMLEVNPSITSEFPPLQVHPLSIGGKDDPPRLVFSADPGEAVLASLVSIGGKLRLVAAEIEVISPPEAMPKLPVAHAVWRPVPDFVTGIKCWLLSGASHHPIYTSSLTLDHFRLFAELAGIHYLEINNSTTTGSFKQQMALLK